MLDYKVPQIEFNGILLPEQDVTIRFQVGAGYSTFNLLVDNTRLEEIEARAYRNPCILIIRTYNIQAGVQNEVVSAFKNLWLLRTERVSPYLSNLVIADNRYKLKGKVINCAYNITLAQNQVGKLETYVQQPSDLKIDFDTFKKGRYALWSVKDDGSPYTMMEIIQRELKKFNVPVIAETEPSNSYILENVELNNQNIVAGLNNLLKASRLNICVDREGSLYAFSVDEDVNFKIQMDTLLKFQSEQAISQDMLYRPDNYRIRPKSIDIKLNRFEECFLIYEKEKYNPADKFFEPLGDRLARKVVRPKIVNGKELWSRDAENNMRVIALQNVINLPNPITFDGKEYSQGEYMPIQKYFFYLGISDQIVRENWFADMLVYRIYIKLLEKYGQQTREKVYTMANLIATAIKGSYLQLFMVDPYVLPYINHISNRELSVIDAYSKYHVLAPVYADYTIVPHLRNPRIAKRLENWNNSLINWNVDKLDPYRRNATAQYFEVVNRHLGVLKICFPDTMYSTLQDLLPFKLSLPPERALGQSINNLISLPSMMDKCVIDDDYYLLIRASINWKAKETPDENDDEEKPNHYDNPNKYHVIKYNEDQNLPAFGEVYTKFFPMISAKFSMRKYKEDGSIDVEENTLVNEAYVSGVSKSIRQMIRQQFRNYFKGRVILAGFIHMRLFSNLCAVVFSFSPSKGTCTTYEASEYIPYSLEHITDQFIINKLHGQLLDSQLQ